MKRSLTTLLACCVVGACSTSAPYQSTPAHVAPLAGSPIVGVETPYTQSLFCVAEFARAQNYPAPRVAIGHITDFTGADDALTGRRVTQGAALMAMSAVSKAGMRVVERYDMGIIQVELEYAKGGLLRDGEGVLRQTKAGQVEGADLYIVGGITEYNPNIRSSGVQAYAGTNDDPGGALSIGRSEYIIDVGLDLRMIDTRSTEVLGVKTLRKQIRGREIEAGIFSFSGGSVVDIGGGQRALEPVQTAVRSMVERAVFEFISELYNLPADQCGPNVVKARSEVFAENNAPNSARRNKLSW
jgi:holdfast attachment protein HfaB